MEKGLVLILGILIVFGIGLVNASTLTRTIPSSSSGDFQITYTVTGVSGSWGLIIKDSVNGGCKFPDGTSEFKDLMLSDAGTTKSITINVPSSTTSCTFTGTYTFANDIEKSFTSQTINMGGTCTPSCTSKQCGSDGCGGSCGTCSTGQTCQSNQCINTNDCPVGQTRCSDGTCCVSTGTCPTGQIKCSDGTCKTSCEITSEGFCLQFADDLLSKYNNYSCQTNTLIIVIGGIIAIILLLALLK